jgi:hypothetical protein
MEVSNMNGPTINEMQERGWIRTYIKPKYLFYDPNWDKLGMSVGDQVWIYEYGPATEDDVAEQDEHGRWWIAPPDEIMSEHDFAYKWNRYCDPWRINFRLWQLISQIHEEDAEEKGAKRPVAVLVQGDFEYQIKTYDIADAERIYGYGDATKEEYAYRLPDGTIIGWTEKDDEGWVRYAWSKGEIRRRLADELSEEDKLEDEDEDE